MTKRYFVLVVLSLAVVLGAIIMAKAKVLAFIDLPSVAVVVAPAVLMGFAAHSPRQIGRSYRVAFQSQRASREELGEAVAYFDGLALYVACGGGIGVTTGVVAMLLVLQDVASIGRGLALCLISALYAVLLIALVVVPFRTAIKRRLAALAG